MQVGDEGQRAPPLSGAAREDDRPGLGDRHSAAGGDAAEPVELLRRDPWSSTTSATSGRHSSGSPGGTPSRATPGRGTRMRSRWRCLKLPPREPPRGSPPPARRRARSSPPRRACPSAGRRAARMRPRRARRRGCEQGTHAFASSRGRRRSSTPGVRKGRRITSHWGSDTRSRGCARSPTCSASSSRSSNSAVAETTRSRRRRR